MAYVGAVTYDEGGRIRTLGAVTYDDGGRTHNLLGAVKYDDGGRFRSLVGLGQDSLPPDMPPPDVGPSAAIPASFPIEYTPPSIAPTFVPFIPSPVVGVTPTDVTGTIAPPPSPAAPPPASAGTLVSVATPAAGALTSILNSVKNIFSGTSGGTTPVVAGQLTPTGTVPTPASASWLTQQTMVSGLPNWGLLAGVGVFGVVLLAGLGGRRRNPGRRRRRNPAELILMGANPSRGKWLQHLGEEMRESGTAGSFTRAARRAGYSVPAYARIKYHAPGRLGRQARFAYVREHGHGMA
jgi:hypothetical protein